jgi:CRISPR-associated protein Cas1
VIQRKRGSVSFAAIDWFQRHAVSLSILRWTGDILAQVLPEEPANPKLRLAQYQSYLDGDKHLSIVRAIIETKTKRQAGFLKALSRYFHGIRVPELPSIETEDLDLIRTIEGRYAREYFGEYSKVITTLGFEFDQRKGHTNQHANDLTNSLLNYGYAVLKSYVRRVVNGIGLDNSVSFLHYVRNGVPSSLTFDLMELWRVNVDYSVIQTLEEIGRVRGKRYGFTDQYEVEITKDTARLLLEKVKLNLSLEEIILNGRILAKYMTGENRRLNFRLNPVEVRSSDIVRAKGLILAKSYRELGMNKSTLWYMRKHLERTGTVRLYDKTASRLR